jgi:DNA-binding NarL/FixJ family response regulator
MTILDKLQNEGLSKREAEIMLLLVDGHNMESIGHQLDLHLATVKTVLFGLRHKLFCNSTPEVIVWFYKKYWEPKLLVANERMLM